MCPERRITVAKAAAIVGFLLLLTATYYIRSEVLALNAIRFSADNLRAENQLKRLKDSHAERLAEYEAQLKSYDIHLKHYLDMLNLYLTDYDAYVRRKRAGGRPPTLPTRPRRPESPEVKEDLMRINASFIAQKQHYFASMSYFNWIAWLGAVLFAGGILYLLMFDTNGKKLFYFLALVLAFVFMIGPSFHSIMSAIVGFLRAPGF